MMTHDWTIRVDWADVAPLAEEAAIAMIDALHGLHPVISPGQPGPEDLSRTHQVMVSIDDALLADAIKAAVAAVEDAAATAIGLPVDVTGVEIVTREEIQRRLTAPQIPELVSNADIAEMLGVTRQRAAQLAARDDFPPAVQSIKAGPLRVRSQVETWAKSWARANGRPRHEPTT